MVGIVLLAGRDGSFFRYARTLPPGHVRELLLTLLLFALVRGLADTEPFDLSLPLWAVVLFTYLPDAVRESAVSTSPERLAAPEISTPG